MTSYELLKQEMKRRGLTDAQCTSKTAAVVLDIVCQTGMKYTQERDDIIKRENEWDNIRFEKARIESEREAIKSQWQKIDSYVDNLKSYVDVFYKALEETETSEGRDALKRAQMFVNTVDVNTKYDNTAYIIGLASILSCGKTGAIDELRKINKEIPIEVRYPCKRC